VDWNTNGEKNGRRYGTKLNIAASDAEDQKIKKYDV
jgi:hypothetical protein